jgi:D-lyxose ketol-isomerase
MKRETVLEIRKKAAAFLGKAHIVITPDEAKNIEVADCGLGDFEHMGLALVVYENNPRYCAKELILIPGQAFPEHRHPALGPDRPGKQETFRCRFGEVYVHVPGEPTPSPKASVPETYRPYLKAWKEIVLRPGQQFTLPPDTPHWFQAGPEGAIVSEFSSTSTDERDVFTDPRVKRVPTIE